MKRIRMCVTAFASAFVLAGAAVADPAWLAIAREMAADGESVRPGVAEGGGWYVAALSEIVPAEGGSEEESLQRARLFGKRLLAGFVSGEKVGSSEESSVSEVTVGEKTETTETFRQRITVDVDAVLRGAEVVGTVDGSGGRRFLALVASAETADASKALAEKMKELPPDTVCASGFAPVSDDGAAAAQKAALAAAKASAVEMVLGTAVASTEAAMNLNVSAKVFSAAGGFIENFRVTEEGDCDGAFKVTIVAKVARGKLMDDYSAFLSQFGDVKFHVEDIGNAANRAMLEEKFLDWKVPLTTDPRKADYLVWSKWEFRDEVHPVDGRMGTRLTLTLAMRDAATGKEYWTVNNDPRKAVSFVGDQKRRMRNAADLAMEEIHEKVHERLDAMIGKMSTSGRDMRMVFDNWSEMYAETLEAIRKAVETIPGCGGATTATDARSRTARIDFRCQTDMDTFRKFMVDAIAKAVPGKAMRPDHVSSDATTWNLTW